MQTTSEPTVAPRPRARRRPSRAALAVAGVVAALSLALVLLPLFNIWPPPEQGPQAVPTPTDQYATGLQAEIIGKPVQQGEQWIVTVKVTNNVKKPAGVQGTPTPDVATPTAGPAKVLNGTVIVIFYDRPASDPARQTVGHAIGNVVDLPYGESKTIQVVAVGVGRFADGGYAVYPDSVWTDKDPVKEATPSPAP